jgi:hypothetical protein
MLIVRVIPVSCQKTLDCAFCVSHVLRSALYQSSMYAGLEKEVTLENIAITSRGHVGFRDGA